MALERSRRALKLAEQHLVLLEEVAQATDADLFGNVLACSLPMIRNIGPVLDAESQGARTAAFGMWWANTRDDKRHQCIAELRNAVFKGMEEDRVQVAEAEVRVTAPEEKVTAYNPTVVTTETTRVEVKHIREGQVVDEQVITMTVPANVEDGPTVRRKWVIVGGDCDGQDLLGALRNYVEWMRDEILPEAERLLVVEG
ncbi:hypothetical protein [Streptomyces sp. NPDC057301]|uniref:hypothetical protein n=1 Tax=Streptomyces sp. NPDC057301 TaxID=3346093 RepID=UPI00363C9AC3